MSHPGNLNFYKTNKLVSSTNKLQEEGDTGEPERNLEKYQPIAMYESYLDPNLDKPTKTNIYEIIKKSEHWLDSWWY